MRNRLYIRTDVAIAILIIIAMWTSWALFWFVTMRSEPVFEFKSVASSDYWGRPKMAYTPGEIVVVKRDLCMRKSVGVKFSPALRNEYGVVFPLPGIIIQEDKGCYTTRYGFLMPDLPPGKYTYFTTVMYQTNLIGRDEFSGFPPLQLQISSK
jgi:hypothetical protein